MAVLDPDSLPKHVAIIMDGNGRWAKTRKLPRTMGHKQGVEAARRATLAAGDLGVKYLTLFGFSNENWSRPESEISELMTLLRMFLRAEAADLHKNNVRLRVIGRRDRMEADIVELIENTEKLTAGNTQLNLTIALDYGGRQDIVQAVQKLIAKGMSADKVDEKTLSAQLLTKDLPDPDLLIRTSGEQRISNFLLWQTAYTEFVFDDVLWPDFGREHMERALANYACRQRRFGGVELQDSEEPHKKSV
jgi:undecaprenyl diphosphate synthase